ncbi:50S ribosomal protein L30e [Desulfurococcus amylolyticus]|uniref:Large ribosomal subunit protein eL30 n=1 Tax=Desulfurococcus amylolyticus (strain DSM 18924 / JCM 16383 / VKM B-2413 / 1221n) TaxID=490899 RepID=B8D6G7_DESA1|nr:50S ribosomal protein L30e [Desulfurococcus amylolyticus]ACL11698.1 50S ribosomal protein L30e [Desulfurococcus amylolyticus 1221n]
MSSQVDLLKAIRTTADTGQIVYGSRQVRRLVLHGKAKAVIIASNASPEIKRDLIYYAKLSNIPVIMFPGTSIELGTLLGRPHSITSIAVIDPGQSNILDFAGEV